MQDEKAARLARSLCLTYTGRLRTFVDLQFPGLESDTDDVVQSILEKVLRRVRLFDSSYSEGTWVYSIARNHCIDLVRKQKRHPGTRHPEDLDFSTVASALPGPEEAVLAGDESRRIRKLVAALPSRERQALWLSVYEEMSFREIARVMDIPEGTAKYLKHRAKQIIREKWEEA